MKDAIGTTKEKLDALKQAQVQAREQLENGTLGQDRYDALQREIIETEGGLRRLQEEAARTNTTLAKISEVGGKLENAGNAIAGAGRKMMGVTTVIGGLGTAAVKTAADFDTSMSRVAAVSGAAGKDLEALRDKAREMGAKTKFSAGEAAEAMNYGFDIIGLNQKEPNSKGDAEFSPVLILSFRRYLMQGKESINLEQRQESKKIKSIKVLYSNSHTDRPKISMEGKWLEQIGFQIGDRLAVSYGDGFIFISHHSADNSHPLAVYEPLADAYMAETDGLMDMGQAGGCRNRKDIKNKQIKVTSSMHVRQRAGYGGPFYYPERSKISMEGKWLEKAGFHIGDRVQVKYSENAICIYLAA